MNIPLAVRQTLLISVDRVILVGYIQDVPKVALPRYLVVIIRRCKMCIEHAGQ
jgi:hypothetical protein